MLRFGLLIVGTSVLLTQAAESVSAACATPTYTVGVINCLYACKPTPTITYTTTAYTTKTIVAPCPPPFYPRDSVPDKRAVTCSPVYITEPAILPCTLCPLPTAAKTTVVTSSVTLTTYYPCPTRTYTISVSSVSTTPASSVSTDPNEEPTPPPMPTIDPDPADPGLVTPPPMPTIDLDPEDV